MQKKNNKMTSTENLLKTILNVNSVVIDGIRLQADPPGGMSIVRSAAGPTSATTGRVLLSTFSKELLT